MFRRMFRLVNKVSAGYIYSAVNAAVVKLVDTLASGASSRKGLGVRVSPAAHPISYAKNFSRGLPGRRENYVL